MGFFYLIGSCGEEAWDYSGLSLELLDMIGRGYVVEHCVSSFNKRQKELAFQIYVTDTLKSIDEKLFNTFGGTAYKDRFIDRITSEKKPVKSGDEIAAEVIKKAGLKLK